MKRRLLIILVVLVALIGIGYFALHLYLGSHQVTDQVVSRLESVYGGKASVRRVDVGLGSSRLEEVQLFEKDSPKDAEPWLKVAGVKADVSLWQLATGAATPRHVTLEQPTILLRFDRDGRLLTQFPLGNATEPAKPETLLESAPGVDLVNGRIIFRKTSQPDLVVKNVNVRLTRTGSDLSLSGTADNAELGKLGLDGSAKAGSNRVSLHAKTEAAAHVDQAFLQRVPFVPATFWQEVAIPQATATGELTVSYNLKNQDIHYRLDLDPSDAAVSIPAVELNATKAHGIVIVEDNVVHLRDVNASALGGTVQLSGDFDFHDDIYHLDFPKIDVKDLDVSKIPPSIGKLPPQLREMQGRLIGSAQLHLTIKPGPIQPAAVGSLIGLAAVPAADLREPIALAVRTPLQVERSGRGQVKIVNGKLLGDPVDELDLEWDPQSKTFTSKGTTQTSKRPAELNRALVPAMTVSTTVVRQEQRDSDILYYPLRVIDTVVGGVQTVSQQIADTVNTVSHRLAAPAPPKKAEEKTSYLNITLKMSKIDLAQFTQKLGLKLPFSLAGKLSFQVKASLPVDRPTDMKAYQVHGTAQVVDFEMEGVHVSRLDAEVEYQQGVLELKSLKGSFPLPAGTQGGTFQGTAKMQIIPYGALTANLDLDRVPLEQFNQLDQGKVKLGGTISGKLNAQGVVAALKNPQLWKADGTLTSDLIRVEGLSLREAAAGLTLRTGALALTKFQAKLEGAPVEATAVLRLTGALPFEALLHLRNWDVASLQRLSPEVRPPIPIAGTFTASAEVKGQLQPLKYQAAGDVLGAKLQIDKFAINNARFRWETAGDQLVLKNFAVQMYGGEATGQVRLPLKSQAAGSIDLHIDKIDAKQLVKDLPVPVKIEGQVEGEFKATLPPAPDGKPRTARASLDLKAPKLRVQNIPTEQLKGTLDYKKGVIDYKLEGHTLGGTFELEGQIPGTQPAAKAEEPKDGGRLRFHGIDLAQLVRALRMEKALPLGGTANLDLKFTQTAPHRLPDGTGVLRIANLTWQQRPLIPNLEGQVTLKDGVIRLPDLNGDIDGGAFRVRLAYNVLRPEQGWFVVNADNIESAQLLTPWLKPGMIQGPLNLRLRGSLGSEWSGSADVELMRGKIAGLDVNELRVPASWRYAPREGRGQIEVYEGGGQVARGRMQGRLSYAWDVTARAEGQLRFFGVDMANLLRETAGSSQLVAGHVTGRFDFVGRDMRSVNDLTGTLHANFNQAQPLQLPLLSPLAPHLGVGPSATFQKGAVVGRLDRGIFRIQSLTLSGGTVDVFLDGTISLEERLNLEVVAKTGQVGLPTQRLRILGLRLPIAGPLPVTLALEASNLLSNQVIYLRVTGTLRHPVVRPEPVRILTAEAIRYFVYRAAFVSNP